LKVKESLNIYRAFLIETASFASITYASTRNALTEP
jgi:hypothetical protein